MCEYNQDDSVGGGSLPQKSDCLASRIDQCIERGNNWLIAAHRTSFENYIHGNIKFALEYVQRGRFNVPDLILVNRSGIAPTEYATAEICSPCKAPEIGHTGQNLGVGQFYLIHRWDQEPVFVDNIEGMDQVEKLVPTSFFVRAKLPKGAIKSCPGALAESLMYGFVKSVCFFTERELNAPVFSTIASRRDYIPVDMVQRGPDVMNDITSDNPNRVYDGFVLFGPQGSLSGTCIRFDNKSERSIFAQKFVKISDVFRGPLNLEGCTICHGQN